MIVLLALLAGLAAGLAQPPYGLWVGVLGYGLIAHLVDRADRGKPLRSAFWRGWLAGVAYFAVSCWWVVDAFLVDAKSTGWMAPFGLAALAGGVALFWGLGALAYRFAAYGFQRKPGHLGRALIFAGCFTLSEWLRGHLMTGFPWALPGETWPAGGPISQAASLVGAYGLTWLTLFTVCALWQVRAGLRGAVAVAVGAVTAAALLGFGFWRLHEAPRGALAPGAPVIRLVQPNIGQDIKYSDEVFFKNFTTYLTLTSKPVARRPDVVVWPEGALPYAFDDYLGPGKWTAGLIGEALSPGQTLLVGGYHYVGARSFNSLAAVTRAASGVDHKVVYDKFRLVPFGEYLPLEPLMKAIGFSQLVPVGDGFSSGPPPAPVSLPGLPLMQPLICYEDIFPGFTRDGLKRSGQRAQWILVVSDDAWFGRGAGPRQHQALAAYRAIEEGLPMLRATPTGVSAVVDPYGRVLSQLGPSIQGVIDAVLPASTRETFYELYGDWVLLMMIFGSIVAVATRRNAN